MTLGGIGIGIGGRQAAPQDRAARALADLAEGLRSWPLWLMLARGDIRRTYRRSVLGPFWLTLSMALFVLLLSLLYGRLLGLPMRDYVPYLTAGYLVWTLITGIVNEGCRTFIEAERYLKQARLPKSLFVFRVLARSLLVFAHNAAVFLAVAVLLALPVTLWTPFSLLGLAAVLVNGAWVALLLGLLSARFRDVPEIVGSLMRLLFFASPILFRRDLLGEHAYLIDYNPITHFIAVVRMPLLGEAPSLASWLVVLGLTLLGAAATFAFFARFRARLAYWL